MPHGRIAVVGRHRDLSGSHATIRLDGEHVLSWQAVIYNDILQHINVQRDVKGTRSHGCHLSEHDVFSDTVAIVLFSNRGSFHENFNGLLEGTSHEGPSVRTVDTMPGDGHESTPVGHQIAKESEVSIIDVGPIEFDNLSKFLHDCSPGGFDSKDVEYLHTAVGICPSKVHAFDAHDSLQIDTVSFQHPLLLVAPLDTALRRDDDLVVFLEEDPFDSLDTTQTD